MCLCGELFLTPSRGRGFRVPPFRELSGALHSASQPSSAQVGGEDAVGKQSYDPKDRQLRGHRARMFLGLILCACPTPGPVHPGPHLRVLGLGDPANDHCRLKVCSRGGSPHLELLGPQTPTWAVHKAGSLPALKQSGQSLTPPAFSLCVC